MKQLEAKKKAIEYIMKKKENTSKNNVKMNNTMDFDKLLDEL